MKEEHVVCYGAFHYKQTALNRKIKALVKGRIAYVRGKRVNYTYFPESYKVKITGCVQMILVQQGIGCILGQ